MADKDAVSGLVAPDGYPTERAHLLAAFDEQAKGLTERPATADLLKAMGWLTAAAREGDWPALEERLRYDLPAIIQHLGLTLDLEVVVSYLINRCQTELGTRRVTDMLSDWLAEFAVGQGLTPTASLTPDEVRRLIVATAAKDVIKSCLKDKPSKWNERVLSWLHQQGPEVLGGDLRDANVPTDLVGPADKERLRDFLKKLADSVEAGTRKRLKKYQPSVEA